MRPREHARSATPVGAGAWVADAEWPLNSPPPVTTIAWRLVHLATWTDIYRDCAFGAAELRYDTVVVPPTAAEAVAWLERAQSAFAAAVAAVPDDQFDEHRPTHWGEQAPIAGLAWQIVVEHLHHSAEIGVLRDLHRGHGRSDWWPEPLGS